MLSKQPPGSGNHEENLWRLDHVNLTNPDLADALEAQLNNFFFMPS
jgi:DNA-binding TFAR19-related protein (PDSD5 family)